MKVFKYIIPNKIVPSKGIFEFINILFSTFKNKSHSKISLQSESTKFIDPSLMAHLGLVLTKLKSQQNYIVFNKLNKLNRDALSSCGFLQLQDINSHCVYNKFLVYKTFSSDDYDNFIAFLNNELKSLSNVEQIDIITSSLSELFMNVQMHSGLKPNRYGNKEIFVSGYINEDLNTFNFSICNNGKPFSTVIREKRNISYTYDFEYIKWALKESNTTRDTSTPGGLGLFLLYDLIKNCNGSLFICSGKGYFSTYPNCNDVFLDLSSPFPGTAINIILPLSKLENIKSPLTDKNKTLTIEDLFKEEV